MNNKYNFRGSSIFNKGSNNEIDKQSFFYGVVTSVSDSFNMGHIKARIRGIDDHLNESELPKSFPLQPKFIYIKPKVGETVLIFTPEKDNPFTDRFYLGPLISQPQFLNDSPLTTAKSGLNSGYLESQESPNRIPEVKGVFPTGDDLAIQGRQNTDILFKDNEIVLRANKGDDTLKIKNFPTFNKKSQAYIQLKGNIKTNKDNQTISLVNVVANKINLLTHENGSPFYNLHDQEKQISDAEMIRILETAHPAAFGDKMVEYFLLMREVLLNHVHAYPGLKGQDLNGEEHIKKLLDFDIKSLVSKNIKLN